MPTLAKKITLDFASKKLLIDGGEFPWLIAEGPRVTGTAVVPVVVIGLLADEVEVIPVVS